MRITHHSNYIRWMEEARVDFLDRIGYGYAILERDGIISPVIGVECQYKHPTTFNDEVKMPSTLRRKYTVLSRRRMLNPFLCSLIEA